MKSIVLLSVFGEFQHVELRTKPADLSSGCLRAVIGRLCREATRKRRCALGVGQL